MGRQSCLHLLGWLRNGNRNMTTSTTCGDRYKDGCNFFETEDSFPDPHNGKIFLKFVVYKKDIIEMMQEMSSTTQMLQRKGQPTEKQSQLIIQDEEEKQGSRISSCQKKLSRILKYILPPLCILFLTLNFTVEEIELVSVLLQPFQ